MLHPITLIVGVAWKRSLERQGRIRLEEDVERVEGRREREERERA